MHLADREPRQLKSRSGFWSNYSDRFERIRILLPQSSVENRRIRNSQLRDWREEIAKLERESEGD